MPNGQIASGDVGRIFRLTGVTSKVGVVTMIQFLQVDALHESGAIEVSTHKSGMYIYQGYIRSEYTPIEQGELTHAMVDDDPVSPNVQRGFLSAFRFVREILDITDELEKHPDCKLTPQ